MSKLIVEVEVTGLPAKTLELAESSVDKLVQAIHEHAGTSDVFIFEKEKDDQLTSVDGRSAISVVVHRCKRIQVNVNFEHRTETETFPPSATVFRVLRWAIGKKAFNLDDTARAKANLILPGQESPLPREDAIGKYVTSSDCSATFELTLRDFTNGRG